MSVLLTPHASCVGWSDLFRYYREHYAFEYRLKSRHPGDPRFKEAYEWCAHQWGIPAKRSSIPLGFLCAHDSQWNFAAGSFFFKDEESCVLFQLRWR